MITHLGHTAIRTRDLDASLKFYTEVIGLREAFRMCGDDGKPFIRMERDEKTGYRYMKVGGLELRDQTEKKDTPDAEDTNKPKE